MIDIEKLIYYIIILISLLVNFIQSFVSKKDRKEKGAVFFENNLLAVIRESVCFTESVGLVGADAKKKYCISLIDQYLKVYDKSYKDYQVLIDSEIETLIDFSKEVN